MLSDIGKIAKTTGVLPITPYPRTPADLCDQSIIRIRLESAVAERLERLSAVLKAAVRAQFRPSTEKLTPFTKLWLGNIRGGGGEDWTPKSRNNVL